MFIEASIEHADKTSGFRVNLGKTNRDSKVLDRIDIKWRCSFNKESRVKIFRRLPGKYYHDTAFTWLKGQGPSLKLIHSVMDDMSCCKIK